MQEGDIVIIYDLRSDLYCMVGQVVKVENRFAVVMVEGLEFKDRVGYAVCIIDKFEVDKLHVKERRIA